MGYRAADVKCDASCSANSKVFPRLNARYRFAVCMMSLVPLRAGPFVCRKLSPALARLYFLALGGLHFVKTIINRFILVHPVRGAKKS